MSIVPTADQRETRAGLLPVAILIASNLVPIAGILWWDWDAFVLLSLYWLETAVFGFWMILRILAFSQAGSTGAGRSLLSAVGLAGFFMVHAGIFMSAHMVFLWALFSGAWKAQLHDARDFIRLIVIGKGLWLPLLALFVARGAVFVNDVVNRFVFRRPQPQPTGTDAIVGGFYQRIMLMHVAIIGGGLVAMQIGSAAPLVVLVLLKTALDIHLERRRRR
ncbi:DUF6498-containing protein [Bradyrhizobium prioriisuperbiae]|uniref:DUF6498-containing protein n=1 Tax=Bradyrhizobium prioriisuperbiae TaxID=2854389 RepID=UPI0028E24C1B|nr:DUF6498-containing protein [Bradyrhizobium prioritasuperba]